MSRTIILATGVVDKFPIFDGVDEYVGRSLFWCITCDGYKVRNKKVLIIGHSDEALCTCLQFLQFTNQLTFLTNCIPQNEEMDKLHRERLKNASIPIIEGTISKVKGHNGMVKKVILQDGTEIETDFIFSLQGAVPNSFLAEQLNVKVNKEKYIELIDLEQRTNVPGVYAAGDITKVFSHQIASAVHEGSMAGQAVNYDLYAPEQREDEV